jgi:DNA-binding NarL/FixJ family response regulator
MPPRIIIFEDDEQLTQELQESFRAAGWKVSTFLFPPDNVVELVAGEKGDIILMDVNMPHMNGVHAGRLLKAAEKTNHIPLVYYSSMPEESILPSIHALGADGFFSKWDTPPRVLVEEIKKIIK